MCNRLHNLCYGFNNFITQKSPDGCKRLQEFGRQALFYMPTRAPRYED